MSHLRRAVGVLILSFAAGAALLVWFGMAANNPSDLTHSRSGVLWGFWHVLYNAAPPSANVLVTALGAAGLLAAGVAWLDYRILLSTRRSPSRGSMPLVPKTVMAVTRSVFAGHVSVTVLIPAHNEEARIGRTLEALRQQSTPARRVILVADNCVDGTVAIARAAGVEVIETVGNRDKKAGALNQVLRSLLVGQGHNDLVMVLDADTVLAPEFLEAAARRFAEDRALMAVGGLFYGEDGSGMLGQLQRNEYTRYARDIGRRNGRLFVLTGTASMFRSMALRTVAERRGSTLPGRHGDVYDTAALTEDNELTLALKSLGALMVSPPQCRAVTEVMATWRGLWVQRLRRLRGALENLGAYGLTRQTLRYWAQQLGIGYGVIAFAMYAAFMVVMAFTVRPWVWYPFWLGVGVLLITERVVTVWSGGWRARLLAALLIPELLYTVFFYGVYVTGVLHMAMDRRAYGDLGDHAVVEEPC